MMGYNHVSSGLVAGLATLPVAPVHHWPAQAAWVISFGGTALLPDLDSRQATASRMWGPLTQALGACVSTLARGHRWGTHDAVLAPLAFAGLTALAAWHPLTLGAVLALAIGLSLRGLALAGAGHLGAAANLLASTAGAWWLVTHGATHTQLLPLVVAAGVLVHIAGDFLTEEGIPIPVLWLFGNRSRLRAALFTTNNPLERYVVAPALSLTGLWLLSRHTGIHDLPTLLAWAEHALGTILPI